MNESIRALVALALGTALSACSVKAGWKPNESPQNPDQKSIKYLGLEGEHESACIAKGYDFYRITMSVMNAEAVIKKEYFLESACLKTTRKEDLKGTLFDLGMKGTNQQVQLYIPIDGKSWSWHYFLVNKNGGQTSISEFASFLSDLNDTPIRLMRAVGKNASDIQPAPPSAPPAPPPASSINIEPGTYTPVGQGISDNICDRNLGVGRINGKVTELYITSLYPCVGLTFSFSCDGKGECRNSSASVTILSETRYKVGSYEFRKK